MIFICYEVYRRHLVYRLTWYSRLAQRSAQPSQLHLPKINPNLNKVSGVCLALYNTVSGVSVTSLVIAATQHWNIVRPFLTCNRNLTHMDEFLQNIHSFIVVIRWASRQYACTHILFCFALLNSPWANNTSTSTVVGGTAVYTFLQLAVCQYRNCSS